MKSRAKLKETGMKIVFLIAACVSVFAVVLICVFLFANGIPAMREIGIFDFLRESKRTHLLFFSLLL